MPYRQRVFQLGINGHQPAAPRRKPRSPAEVAGRSGEGPSISNESVAEPRSLCEHQKIMTSSSSRPRGTRRHRFAFFLIGVVSLALGGCGSEYTTTEAGPGGVLSCDDDLAGITDLLRSGLPTYDYDSATDLAALVQGSDVVVVGTIDSLVRNAEPDSTGPDSPGDESWTTVSSADARILAQPGAGTIDSVLMFSMFSKWVVRGQPDPLSGPATVDGLAYVAFLHQTPAVPGGFTIDVQGLLVGCVGTAAAATPVVAPLPSDATGLSLDALAVAVSDSVATE